MDWKIKSKWLLALTIMLAYAGGIFALPDMLHNPLLNNVAMVSLNEAPYQASAGSDIAEANIFQEVQFGYGFSTASITVIHYMGPQSFDANDSSAELNNIFLENDGYSFLGSVIGGYRHASSQAYAHPYLAGSLHNPQTAINVATGVILSDQETTLDLVTGFYQHLGHYLLPFFELTTMRELVVQSWQLSLATGTVIRLGDFDLAPQLYLAYTHDFIANVPGVSARVSAIW